VSVEPNLKHPGDVLERRAPLMLGVWPPQGLFGWSDDFLRRK